MDRMRVRRQRTPGTQPTPERTPEATPTWDASTAWSQTSAQPLDPATQAAMSGRFGHNFADVRVHADARAGESATALGARAFAVGRDISFGPGQYRPETAAGQQLLAHELTHVVQHDRASQTPDTGVSHPGDAAEREAGAVAGALHGGGPLPPIAAAPAAAVQRDRVDPATAPPAPQPTTAPPGGEQAPPQTDKPTFESFNLADVLAARDNIALRLADLTTYATLAAEIGEAMRDKLLKYSDTYRNAYKKHAEVVKTAKLEADNENFYLNIAVGAAIGLAAAFALPSTAGAAFFLTASDAGIALVSSAGQAVAGAKLMPLIQFAGGDLSPAELSPEAQELGVWKRVSRLYRAAAIQIPMIDKLGGIVRGAEVLYGEIRAQVAGGPPTMTQAEAQKRVDALLLCDAKMAEEGKDLQQQIAGLSALEARISAIDPKAYTENQMEQDIWILWIADLPDSAVLDRDPIENHLHAIGVLGKASRLNVDFGGYTFFWDEMLAQGAAKLEASNLREKVDKGLGIPT